MRIALIDHEDSFSLNIREALFKLGLDVDVYSGCDSYLRTPIVHQHVDAVVLGPGPGHPAEQTHTLEFLQAQHSQIPILGICLGHQIIVHFFGGSIRVCPYPCHGKSHLLESMLPDFPSGLSVGRYHSWMADDETLPIELDCLAWIWDQGVRIPMIIRHRRYPILGIQFHPESILTNHGDRIFRFFLNTCVYIPST